MTTQPGSDHPLVAFLREHGWAIVLLLPALLAIWLRPLIPPVETRYLNVAWEMWSEGHFLVPVLNTESYSDKPPLFFWLIHLGWFVFGVNEWWPRAIPALLGVLNTALVGVLAARLWPGERVRAYAVWMLVGTLAWLAFTIVLMFDMLLTTCVLVALIGLVQAASGRRRGHVLYAAGLGLGILAKGPVIFLHLLPAALLTPLALDVGANRARWYQRTAAAIGGGILIALLWVVPAALFGGNAYREKILWTQTAGRVSESFAHARPWWYYLTILPVLLLPWFIWPRAWHGLRRLLRERDRGVRFLLCGFVPVFVGFSAISGKQLHYLLPWVPVAVLLAAAGLREMTAASTRIGLAGPAATWIALPVVAALAVIFMAGGLASVHPLWAGACGLAALLGSLMVALRPATPLIALQRLAAAASLGIMLLLVAFVSGPMDARYDVRPPARIIAAAVAQGAPLASTSAYNGEFGFYAHLTVPVHNVGPDGVPAWCAAHPGGLVLDRREPAHPPRPDAQALYVAPYRGHSLHLWPCSPAGAG